MYVSIQGALCVTLEKKIKDAKCVSKIVFHRNFLVYSINCDKIVNEIQNARNKQHCIIINAGGYTHTSVAIHDALKILNIPIIELHITNIYKREDFRHKSLISKAASGIICGLGTQGYTLALKASIDLIKNED